LFQAFFPGIFFFSNRRRKKHKEKKNHRKEKKCKEGRELNFKLLICPLIFGSCFCFPAFAFLLLPFRFKHFLIASSSQTKEKKEKHEEKKIMKKKKCKQGREFTFLL